MAPNVPSKTGLVPLTAIGTARVMVTVKSNASGMSFAMFKSFSRIHDFISRRAQTLAREERGQSQSPRESDSGFGASRV